MGRSHRTTEPIRDLMTAWRRDFHAHPEPGGEERRTAEMVANLLGRNNIEVHTGIGGTGVVGVLRRGSGRKAIGLRAEMDALEITETSTFGHRSRTDGLMHACGHDGHMAMLLGGAHHLAANGVFDGTVFLIFQPGEEPGFGARAMLADGLFERFPAERIYALHNMPSLPTGSFAVMPGPVMACEDHFQIIVQGQGTHAALPHLGVDPLVTGSQLVLALQTLVARSLDPVERAVVSVTEFVTDGSRNVLPSEVTLRGDTRSFSPAVRERIETTMARLAEGICAAHGARCSFTYSHEFVATINAPAATDIAAAAAIQVVGEGMVRLDHPPFMASEDFGLMLQARPGCFLFLGNGSKPGSGCGLHNPGYDFNDENLTVGADFWVRLVETELPAGT